MSFIDDDDDTDDERLEPASRLRRPMSSLNYPISASARSGGDGNALYNRYQGMRSVSSLQRPMRAATTQHFPRRSVSAVNGYQNKSDYQFRNNRPPDLQARQETSFLKNDKSTTAASAAAATTSGDIWDELDLVKEKMQRLNVGTRSGRATPLPFDPSKTTDSAFMVEARTGNSTVFSHNDTALVPKKLRRRRFSLTGANSISVDLTATSKAAVAPSMAPPMEHAADRIDLVPPPGGEVLTSLSQQHLQSVLARLGDRTDIDSLLLDRACADLLRVYPTTTSTEQREALDQVCLSMANFVIKTLDDRQHQHQQQQHISQSQHSYQMPQQQQQHTQQKLLRDPYRTPENNTSSSDSLEINGSGENNQTFESSLKPGPDLQQQKQQQRRLRTDSPLFGRDELVSRSKHLSGIFPEIRDRLN